MTINSLSTRQENLVSNQCSNKNRGAQYRRATLAPLRLHTRMQGGIETTGAQTGTLSRALTTPGTTLLAPHSENNGNARRVMPGAASRAHTCVHTNKI